MENLQEIYGRCIKGTTPTTEECAFIRSKAKEYDVKIKDTRCKNRWCDIIIAILLAERKPIDNNSDIPQLREPYATEGVMWNKQRISQASMTVGLYNRMVNAGLGRLFVKDEQDNSPRNGIEQKLDAELLEKVNFPLSIHIPNMENDEDRSK